MTENTPQENNRADIQIATDGLGSVEYSSEVRQLLESVRKDEERRRNLVRPRISVWLAILNILLPIAVAAGIFCALFFTLLKYRIAVSLGVSLGTLGLYIIVRMRAILIWFIKVYQAVAPDKVRLRCVFTPSCSEYAIAALEKYGVLRGLPKIIGRLKRCHLPNGGEDELQ